MLSKDDINWLNEFKENLSLYLNDDNSKKIIDEVTEILIQDNQYDKEYKDNMNRDDRRYIFKTKYIINTKWRGSWLKCTGIDSSLFKAWTNAAFRDKLFGENAVVNDFKKYCPTQNSSINPIRQSQEIMNKIVSLMDKKGAE